MQEFYYRHFWILFLPLHNPTEAQLVKSHFSNLFRERVPVMVELLGAPRDLKVPNPWVAFLFAFFVPTIDGATTTGGHIFLNARLFYFYSDKELARTIDHELTHYIQNKLNKKLHGFHPSTPNRRRFFGEGFAEFSASLTNRNSPGEKVMKGIAMYLEGKKLKGEIEYYVRGYLAFRAIARFVSIEEAIKIGMTSNFPGLKKKSSELCRQYGIRPYF